MMILQQLSAKTVVSTILVSLLTPLAALAAAGGEHVDGIPMSVVYQAINFALFAGLGFYFLRKPVREYFLNRERVYKQALMQAETARREAEARKREIEERLRKLQATSEQSIAQARSEAEALRARIVQDASELSSSLRAEAARTAAIEVEKAKNELREELLSQAVALSRQVLEEKMAEPDQKRLQTEFVDKIQVVR